MKNTLSLALLQFLIIGDLLAAQLDPNEQECAAVLGAAERYRRHADTNDLVVIESFHIKYPNLGGLGISKLKNDDSCRIMLCRLFNEVPNGAKCRKWIIHKLMFAAESDLLLRLYINTALNTEEWEDTRFAAISGLLNARWTNAQPALAEIFLKINDDDYRDHMLDVAVNSKKPVLAEVFLGYYRHFHPKRDDRYDRHHARLQELKAKLAEDAKNPKPDPLALARAENEWWDKFIRKERKVTLAEARAGLANFATAPVLERLELAYAIQQSVLPDADLVKRLEHLIPDEPSALVKMAMINTIAMHQPNLQAKLQYYRRVVAKEKNPEVVRSAQHYIKLIEDGVLKR